MTEDEPVAIAVPRRPAPFDPGVPGPPPVSRRVERVLRRTAMFALLAALVSFGMLGCANAKADYGGATLGMFMQSCDPEQAGGKREAVCRCAYERIREKYTYAEYAKLDAEQRKDPNRKLPDEVLRLVAACAVTVDLGGSVPGQSSSSSSGSSSSSSGSDSSSSFGSSSSSSS
jgi:uncharacterized membrane protein YgcG